MMKVVKRQLTLYRPATYEIKVPGHLDASRSEWAENMAISLSDEGDAPATTTLTGQLDQAALQGLLRRLYALGLPLISVVWIDQGD